MTESSPEKTSTEKINVIALFKARLEHVDELKQRLIVMAEATHQEDGCLLYSLQQGTEDPTVLAFIEQWDSEAALDKHGTQPHIVEGGDERNAMMAEAAIVVRTRSTGPGNGWPAIL